MDREFPAFNRLLRCCLAILQFASSNQIAQRFLGRKSISPRVVADCAVFAQVAGATVIEAYHRSFECPDGNAPARFRTYVGIDGRESRECVQPLEISIFIE
jgi:hypothetical protein